MKKCNQCGTILPDDAKFCRICGNNVSDPSGYTEVNEDGSEKRKETSEPSKVKRCKKCGNIVPEDAKFCRNCGSDMRNPDNYVLEGDSEEKKQEIHPVKKCNHCGNIVPDTAKFCNVCGTDMRDPANFTMVDEETGNPVPENTEDSEKPVSVSDETAEETPAEKTEPQESVHTVKKCKICGNIVSDNMRFCNHCGSDMNNPDNYELVTDADETTEPVEVEPETPTAEPSDHHVEETETSSEQKEETPSEPVKPVHPVKKCKNCGNVVAEDAKFCNICGSDMRDPANYTMVDEETGNPVPESAEQPASVSDETAEDTEPVGNAPAEKADTDETVVPDTTDTEEPSENHVDETETPSEQTEETPSEPEKTVHQVRKCNMCGNIVADDVKFCNICGTDMTDPANFTMVDEETGELVTADTEQPASVSDETENAAEETSEDTEPVGNAPAENADTDETVVPDTTDTEEPSDRHVEETETLSEQTEEAPSEPVKPVHPVKKCNMCGNIVADDAKFCNICGTDMRDPANFTMVDEETGESVTETAEEPNNTEPEDHEQVTPEVVDAKEPSDHHVEETETPSEPVKPVHPVKKCNMCGNIVADDAKFCNICGSDMTDPANYTMVDEETGKPVTENTEQPVSDKTADDTPTKTEPVVEESAGYTEIVKKPTEEVPVENAETEKPAEERTEADEPVNSDKDETEEAPSEPEKTVHQVRKCNMCGNIVADDVKFCNVCGSDMTNPANYTLVDDSVSDQTSEETTPDEASSGPVLTPEDSAQTTEVPSEPEKPVHKVKKCNKCGNIVADDAKFCNVCGSDMSNPANYSMVEEAPVHKVKKCNKCGNIVPDDAKFCNVCGSDMSDPSNYSMVEEAPVHKVKKCNKCGNIVADDAKFCNVCGSDMSDPSNYSMVDEPAGDVNREQVRQAVNEAGAVAGAAVQNATNAVNKAVKSDKVQSFLHNKKAVAGVIAAVVVIVILLIVHAVMPTTINLADYTTINVTGYDGHGTAEVNIDEQKLDNDIYNIAQKKGKADDYYSSSFTPSYRLDKSENLSNGDTVTLTWDVDSDALSTLKIKLKTNDIKKKVSDLKKTETFDAFKGIKVQVSGAAPYGEAELNKDSQDGLNYKLNKTTGLKNGDQVKVTVSSQYDDGKSFTQYVEKYGKMPEKTTKTFVVSDLDDYITSAGDLSDDVIKKMRSQAEDVIKADDVNDLSEDVHLDSLTYQGLYFLKAKDRKDDDGDDYYDDAYNKVYIVELQTFTAEDWDGNTYTEKAYTAVEFNSISKSSDGTINVDLSDYSDLNAGFYTDDDADVYLNGYETQDDLYEDCVTSQADHYTSETKAAS